MEPLPERTSSRLLVLNRKSGSVSHQQFRNVLDFMRPGDALFLNDTRVIPARLKVKKSTGGVTEMLLLREITPGTWEVLLKDSGHIKNGSTLSAGPEFNAVLMSEPDQTGIRIVDFDPKEKFWEKLELYGEIPLPPYITRKVEKKDAEAYQTVFAKHAGAVAAPTAGLHFDKMFLKEIEKKGIHTGWITLHVGYGTFKPLSQDKEISKHAMHEEYYQVTPDSAELFNRTRSKGGRIFVCGTTTLRTLESVKQSDGSIKSGDGRTSIFIYPPYEITTADALITNFHLPHTSLLLLVSAFAGREQILKAYEEAVNQKYRFYSYGDTMLIV